MKYPEVLSRLELRCDIAPKIGPTRSIYKLKTRTATTSNKVIK